MSESSWSKTCVYYCEGDEYIFTFGYGIFNGLHFREEARDMFYHAYRAYMENAYPADELMPLSCKGRYRGVTPNRGDMDDILGK